jgi:transmembrane protein 18
VTCGRRAAVAIYLGKHINKLGAQHWELFAKQPYFDERGVFYSVVVSAPLILNMFIILVRLQLFFHKHWPSYEVSAQINYLLEASRMLIKLKRTELRARARQAAQADQSQQPDKKKD